MPTFMPSVGVLKPVAVKRCVNPAVKALLPLNRSSKQPKQPEIENYEGVGNGLR